MLSVAELIATYETYSDEELCEIDINRDGYSEEAQEAADTVIGRRGGIEELRRRRGMVR